MSVLCVPLGSKKMSRRLKLSRGHFGLDTGPELSYLSLAQTNEKLKYCNDSQPCRMALPQLSSPRLGGLPRVFEM